MLNRAFRTALCAGALLLALCLPASAAQEGDFSVLVNGEAVTFTDAAPLLKDGRSFLPMVETFDALGFAQGDITWDAATRSVTAAKEEIIASAYDPIYGARPLRRYLQHTVETLISKKIIADQVEPGSRITVDCRDGQLTVDSREVLTGEVIDG